MKGRSETVIALSPEEPLAASVDVGPAVLDRTGQVGGELGGAQRWLSSHTLLWSVHNLNLHGRHDPRLCSSFQKEPDGGDPFFSHIERPLIDVHTDELVTRRNVHSSGELEGVVLALVAGYPARPECSLA